MDHRAVLPQPVRILRREGFVEDKIVDFAPRGRLHRAGHRPFGGVGEDDTAGGSFQNGAFHFRFGEFGGRTALPCGNTSEVALQQILSKHLATALGLFAGGEDLVEIGSP